MHAVTRSVRIAVVVALIGALLPVGGAGAAAKDKTYGAPYSEGPTGGDQWSMQQANAEDGRIFVGRLYPIFNPISCAPGGSMAKLEVVHKVTGKTRSVVADFTDAGLDQYSFVTLAVKSAKGKWLASTRQRGPLVGDGSVTAKLFGKVRKGQKVTIQFGLEAASACPNASGATARFTQITVT
jgi:hypothetical protein